MSGKRKASNPTAISSKSYEETGFLIKSDPDDFIIMDNDDEDTECFETVNGNKNNSNSVSKDPKVTSHKKRKPIKAAEESRSRLITNVPKLDKDEHLNTLYSCLSQFMPKSPLVVNGIAHELPALPVIELKEFGEIKLPLTDCQAQELIKTSYRTSTGSDNQFILINKHIRDPSHLLIRTPEWSPQLAQLVVRIAKQLGCGEGSEIEARLSEVYLQATGYQTSSREREETSENGMFGKLIIQLPCRFKGGKHIVYDVDGFVKKTLNFGQNDSTAQTGVYFAAYLNGLEHEVSPITNGYRIVLVYSLYSDTEEKNFLLENESTIERLSCALAALGSKPYRLGIVLENPYNPEMFIGNGLKALQKTDSLRFELLKHANLCIPRQKRVDFYTCFACLTVISQDSSKKFSRNSQIDINSFRDAEQQLKWEETSRTIELRHWTDSNGESIFENHNFDLQFLSKIIQPQIQQPPAKNNLTQDVNLSDLDLWGSVHKEELYFESVKHPPVPPLKMLKKKETYIRCLLVCMPESDEFDILFSSSLSCAIDFMFKSLVNGNRAPNALDCENFDRMLHEWVNKNNPIHQLSPLVLAQYKKKVSMLIDKIGSKKLPTTPNNNKPSAIKIENANSNNVSDKEEILSTSPTNILAHKPRKAVHKSSNSSPSLRNVAPSNSKVDQSASEQYSLCIGVENLENNINIIQGYYQNEKTDDAIMAFQRCILPLIIDENEFVKIPMQLSDLSDEDLTNIDVNEPLKSVYKQESTFFKIAKMMVNLSKLPATNSSQQLLELLDVFTKMLVKHLDADAMKQLTEEIVKEWETFEDVESIRNLIEYRCQWLEAHIVPNLEFTWCMPNARLEQHPIVQDFLHSNRKSMSYVGQFATFKDVLDFCRRFERASGLASGFTVKMEPCGLKPDSPVAITKTNEYFEQRSQRNQSYKLEHENLIDILNR